MTLDQIIKTGINPALALLSPGMDTPQARVMLLTIGLQESRFEHRYQIVQGRPGAKGPARGFWQFELGTAASRGGVWGVFLHSASNEPLKQVAMQRGVALSPTAIWQAIETDDVLAAALARLLLWTDPKALPKLGDAETAWQQYLRTWRPGAYERGNAQQRVDLRAKWARNYAQALEAVQ
ncbi:hypothetical protein [Comamonas sp. 26]|uniref:hypothetical protein n=1 Tax=Comamonas sp. 26 TaxID=2035201 RepID=UPI000C18B113|nr:hypothetical protein [Comamonas sp. 26]PIG09929.1 hypothetical protein CLU84_2894 [Comamonas sp. 26]